MRGPLIASVTCPGCGAPIRIDPWSELATCKYCNHISYVHRPKAPVQPLRPGTEHYGHIHVPQSTVNRSVALVLVIAFVAFDMIVGVVIVVAIAASSASRNTVTFTTTSPGPTVVTLPGNSPTPTPFDIVGGNSGPNCRKAIRCCKAIQPANTGCDGLGMLGEAECARQSKSLEDAARAMNRRCD